MNLKVGIVAAVAALLVAFGAFGLGKTSDVRADILAGNVYILDSHAIESTTGAATRYLCEQGPTTLPSSGQVASDELFTLMLGESIFICVNPTSSSPGSISSTDNYSPINGTVSLDDGDITFDSNDVGFFDQPSCTNPDADTRVAEWPDDACINTIGVGTDQMEIQDAGNNLNSVIVRYTCGTRSSFFLNRGSVASPVTIQQDQGSFQFRILCLGEPTDFTITARPTTVEIVPARSNTSHSLIELAIVDQSGFPALAAGDVDFTIVGPAGGTACSIEEAGVDTNSELIIARLQVAALSTANPASYFSWETDTAASTPVDGGTGTATSRVTDNSDFFLGNIGADTEVFIDSRAAAVFGCNPVDAPGATPGVHTITACVEVLEALDLCKSVTVTVIGPPASITVAAAPTSLRCGEKATVTATVRDSIGQNVSDHTRVEMVTNLGGVLAGTGAVASFAGPTVPISSTVGETFAGVTTAFLLTSESHSGPYEVVATTGGTAAFDPFFGGSFSGSFSFGTVGQTLTTATSIPGINVLGGVFSTPPVSAQVTVSCNIPGPTTAAPAAGATVSAPRTGEGIRPPNTGDAGLASSSSSSLVLFALGGAVALTLAGLATFKVARR